TSYADKITNSVIGKYATINAGAGNDTIANYADTAKVYGGAGNDSFSNYGSYNSILGGAGSDTIENTSLGKYSTLNGGDGNDTIYSFGSNDLLQITGTFSASYNKNKRRCLFQTRLEYNNLEKFYDHDFPRQQQNLQDKMNVSKLD
ncbi:MAG: hypothetical protein IJG32_03445, partial [Selenomonadaceae bacterium]|nr:hypothetical protein [Selenomonadaceae bacterium]